MFDKKEVRRWRRTIYREFEKLGFHSMQIMAASVLAAISAVGTDPNVIAELAGVSPEYALKVTKRLRRERILVGKKLRVAWMDTKAGDFAVMLDAGVAAGEFARFADDKRSAAMKVRKLGPRKYGPRRPRSKAEPGPFRPSLTKSNPLYGLPEWKNEKPR
jgi:hypothetical protein